MQVGIREAKAKLSSLLKKVQDGTEIIITDRGKPVGKIVSVSTEQLPLSYDSHLQVAASGEGLCAR